MDELSLLYRTFGHPMRNWPSKAKFLSNFCSTMVRDLILSSAIFVSIPIATTIKTGRKDKSLAKLHTKAFDADQIWQQLEYQVI